MPPLFVNGTEVKSVYVDGVEQKDVFVDGVQVFSAVNEDFRLFIGTGFGNYGFVQGSYGAVTPGDFLGHIIKVLYVGTTNQLISFDGDIEIPGVAEIIWEIPDAGLSTSMTFDTGAYRGVHDPAFRDYVIAREGTEIPVKLYVP